MKVLVCAFDYETACTLGRDLLVENGLEVIYNPGAKPLTKSEILKVIPDIDAVISGNEIWDEEIYRHADRLKLISRFGIGLDNIDLDGAKKHGIKVCNAPGATNGVAELVVGFMITMARHLPKGHAIAKAGRWDRCFGTEIRGKKIGLLGFGRIPKLIARKLKNFDAELYAYDMYPDIDYADQYGVTMTSMEEIVSGCDVVSLHLPATPQTRNLMNEQVFTQMKPGAFFINTSRGALVDEAALYRALASGRLSGAACDVFATEPVSAENPLFQLENFYCTPHWGSDTYETLASVGEITGRQVVDVLCENTAPSNWINR